jgi:hypothetical protein
MGSIDPFDSAQGKTFARDDNAKIGGSLAAMEKRSTIWRRMITGGSPLDFRTKVFSAISIWSSVQGKSLVKKSALLHNSPWRG